VGSGGEVYFTDSSNARVRRLSCGLCPGGHWCSSGGARAVGLCPAGRYSTPGSAGSRAACSGPCTAAPGAACSEGATSPAGTTCPSGSFCTGGSAPPIACECPGACPPGTAAEPSGALARIWSSSLLAGNGTPSYSNGAGASAATFKLPRAVSVHPASGRILVTDTGNSRLRGIDPGDPANTTTLAAGTGSVGSSDGWFPSNTLSSPGGLAVGEWGVTYIADFDRNVIRALAPHFRSTGGYLSTLAGQNSAPGCTSAPSGAVGLAANFNQVIGLAYSTASGVPTLYATSYATHVIHAITVATANVTLFAGSCGSGAHADGVGTGARFNGPYGLAVEGATGRLYVADALNFVLRRVTPGGVVSTVAGLVSAQGGIDGEGLGPARLGGMRHLAMDSSGAVFLTDNFSNRIRRFGANAQVYPASNTSVVSLWGGASGYVEGAGSGGRLTTGGALGIALTLQGAVVLADAGSHRVRLLTCAVCPAGSFCAHSPATGFTLTPCPGGSFCAAGSHAPTPCAEGFWCAPGSAAPTACPPGTYGLGAGRATQAAGCSALGSCEVGNFCSAGTPRYPGAPCGRGNYCPRGSTAPLPCPALNSVDPLRGVANGPAFAVDTAACLNHCFSGGAGQLSMC
jgi:DNA-binding beta-propeller fold protein YncE